jgi:hypothetical protein
MIVELTPLSDRHRPTLNQQEKTAASTPALAFFPREIFNMHDRGSPTASILLTAKPVGGLALTMELVPFLVHGDFSLP